MTKPEENMAKKIDNEEVAEAPQAPQTNIRWDGSKMVSNYANVCNVSSTREEMTLLFGTNQNWHAGQKELTVELTNRIILNPLAAKRLAILLGNTVNEFEARFGVMDLEVGAPAKEKKS